MKKLDKNIEELCKKIDIPLRDIEEIIDETLITFQDVLFFEITECEGEYSLDISTNMSEKFAFLAKEKLMTSWFKNYPPRLCEKLHLYVKCFDQSNN